VNRLCAILLYLKYSTVFDAVGRKPMWHGGPVEMSKLSILHKGKAVNGATELGHQLYVNADKHDIAYVT